jgi:hypothetical protein
LAPKEGAGEPSVQAGWRDSIGGLAQADNGEGPVGPTKKAMRSLVKYGVMSLAQSISFKNGDAGSRWNHGVLGKNPDALKAIIPSKKPRGGT